jgi:hypothetical protein
MIRPPIPCPAFAVPLVIVLSGASAAASAGAGDAPRLTCAQAAALKIPDVKIAQAEAVPAAATGVVRAAHCRVQGTIGSETRFTLLLPDSWNGRFFMGGGGGFVGSVQNSAQGTVNLGYATVGTDTGHQGGITDASWALNNLERRVNFGYLAVHRTADVARAIIASYYGAGPSRSYFSGCSRGGGQAVMEAIRYPDDFDGIVAGAPALDWPAIGAQFIKDAQATYPDPKNLTTPLFPPETLKTIGARILDACDALDGVRDGVMEDPRKCHVDLSSLPVNDSQRAALKKIYAPTAGRGGEIYPGQPFGGEAEPAGWQAWITGVNPQLALLNQPSLRFGFGTQFFKYLVFNDPDWDYTKYDFSTFARDTELAASYLNATNPDLAPFKAKGHKLILWHGWADAALSAFGTIKYYDAVRARDANADEFVRMFMLPGVLHCNGGQGPDTVDWNSVIADWVEHGRVPDRVIARKVGADGAVIRTRPLCPYPKHAAYSGAGSTDEEKSFVCRE